MTTTKPISFQYNIKENISLEINGIATNNHIPAVENEPDNPPHYEFKCDSIFYRGIDLLPILEELDATEKIHQKAIIEAYETFKQ